MSDKSLSVDGPVSIIENSKERVAYDLAILITRNEKTDNKDRKYWLTLYRQCLKATSGYPLESILPED